jgi:hypothetical protein
MPKGFSNFEVEQPEALYEMFTCTKSTILPFFLNGKVTSAMKLKHDYAYIFDKSILICLFVTWEK